MNEKSLKERMTELRGKYEVVLPDAPYIMCMIDGKNFSRLIKNKYQKPFDLRFMELMDKTAIYVCEEIQYACFAYVQSDEITFVFDNHSNGDCHQNFFGNRISKLLSIIPSTATAKFNQEALKQFLETLPSSTAIEEYARDNKPKVFDCKIWTADNWNDVYAYLLWRQNDCIRNSKQQAAQAYLSHKQLHGLDTDQQIALLKREKEIDWWNAYTDGMRFGRFIFRDQVTNYHPEYGDFIRHVWASHSAFQLNKDGKQRLHDLNIIPDHAVSD